MLWIVDGLNLQVLSQVNRFSVELTLFASKHLKVGIPVGCGEWNLRQ